MLKKLVEAGVTLKAARKNRVYVAGPMTGLMDFNYPAFNAAADQLRALGYEVENPADHGIVPGAEWADYMAYDLTRPGLCGMIALLTDATIMRKNVNGRPAPTQPAALASSQIRTSTGSSGHKLSSGKASAMFCSARRWRHDRSAALHALAHLQGAIGSGNFQCIDTYPPIGHELKILAPFMEGLLLPGGCRQPLSATNQPHWDGHHLLNRKIKFICELTPIRQFED
ncbi:DUF4406 domain-containing protein [Pseudomonas sp. GW101-3H06]|uniref:DUF4406 domain-containing protein n=1 Tax=Pseudomonas sp. GW101-3H06 TaxID=2751347 RepID=UPI00216B41C0|nr:DUF4406 domain-containing protein [Pseudomonas sp. GW101-3H06]